MFKVRGCKCSALGFWQWQFHGELFVLVWGHFRNFSDLFSNLAHIYFQNKILLLTLIQKKQLLFLNRLQMEIIFTWQFFLTYFLAFGTYRLWFTIYYSAWALVYYLLGWNYYHSHYKKVYFVGNFKPLLKQRSQLIWSCSWALFSANTRRGTAFLAWLNLLFNQQ